MLKVDISNIWNFTALKEFDLLVPKAKEAHSKLLDKTGRGNEYLGWVTLPQDYGKEEFLRIKAAAAKIKSDSGALVVIGIGGSYLGARAVIEFLKSPNYNLKKKDTPDIFFAGNNLSTDCLAEIIELVKDRDFSVNVISKSGTTTEPAIAFRMFKRLLEQKYGKEGAADRIYATTDREHGALKQLSDSEGYRTFSIPDNIGGRYSVLTAAGLLPIAVAGINIDTLMSGAVDAMNEITRPGMHNPAWIYACARNLLLQKGKDVEILACYEPGFRFMTEWWKQLFGESEGKEHRGIFPASAEFTADLHSLGQYIQDGRRMLFETIVNIQNTKSKIIIAREEDDIDGLNFLEGRDLSFVAAQAFRGTMLAHVDGGVPNIIVNIDSVTEACVGELIYFFEFSCGISGYMLGINPFDQPGVEDYKRNMFALLGKPGYEAEREALMQKL